MTNFPNLKRVVDAAIDDENIVGSVILVSQDGALVHTGCAGYFDREAGTAMREDAIFRLASFTKPLVAATALAMVERGVMALDQPVTETLDYFRPRLGDGEHPTITIGHLLTHTGGIGGGGPDFERAGVAGGLSDTDLSLDENLRRLAGVALLHRPGTGWVYGKGLDVLGGVVATRHGTSLHEAVSHYLLRPLGLVHTGFVVTDRDRLGPVYADNPSGAPRRMAGTTYVPGRGDSGGVSFSPDRVLNPRAFQSGGSGAVGTAREFLRFLEALRLGGAPVLSADTIAMATSNRIGAIKRLPGNAFGYFGGVITDAALAETPQAVGTYEWGGIYGHRWFVDPTNRLTVVMMSNTANEGCSGDFPRNARNAIYADFRL